MNNFIEQPSKVTKNKCPTHQSESGFTLIELLVVVIIVGVLSAISIPSYLAQIGKAREAEAKNNLGAFARAQKVYHFEHQVFASTLDQLSSNSSFNAKFYTFPNADVANNALLRQRAIAINGDIDIARNYAIGIYFNDGIYNLNICEGRAVGEVVEASTTPAGDCTNNGTKISG